MTIQKKQRNFRLHIISIVINLKAKDRHTRRKWSLRLVPATSPGDQVPSCELPIFTRKSTRKDLSNYAGLCVWTVRGTSRCDQIKINQSQISITSSHNSLRSLFWNNLLEYDVVPTALFLGFRTRKPGKSALRTRLTWALKMLIKF